MGASLKHGKPEVAANTTSSDARTAKRMTALLSRAEMAEIELEAEELLDSTKLLRWSRRKAVRWLVTLDRLIDKVRGPSAIPQAVAVIDRCIRHTSTLLEMKPDEQQPLQEVVLPEPEPEEPKLSIPESNGQPDREDIEELLKESRSLLNGD